MLGLAIAFLITAWIVYMILKKYQPQTILFVGGMVLLVCVIVFNFNTLVPAKQSTGSQWLDIFELTKNILSSRAGGLGLIIMSIAGFAKYMDYVGAGKALYGIVATPIKWIGSPYLILTIAFLLGQLMVLFIPSHTGLALLLMATMYPILIRSGISQLSALATVDMCHCMDYGPGSASVNFASSICGLEPAVYFVHYQLPIVVFVNIMMAISIYFSQKWWDKKDGICKQEKNTFVNESESETSKTPKVYALLPVIPLVLLLGFSPLTNSPIKLNVVTAMLISVFVSMVFEMIYKRDVRAVFSSLMVFFEGMGKIFISVVSLLVGGQLFAEGLIKIGAIDTLIVAAQTSGVSIFLMIIIAGALLAGAAFLMGSGDAALFAFGSLIPKITAGLGTAATTLMVPMQLLGGLGRTISPIAPPNVAISGMVNVNPIQVSKRVAIPMLVAALSNLAITFVLLYI